MFFRKKKQEKKTYDAENCRPAVRISICTGEKTAGFRNIHNGHFEEAMLITGEKDMEEFREQYGIEGEIESFY
jgi:hypothetical protein